MDISQKPIPADYCLSAKEAAQILESLQDIPTFGSYLMSMYDSADIRKKLTEAFLQTSGENFTAVDRKIRNWLNGKNEPQDRESIFICAFALNLDETQTSSLLGLCCGSEIHYRNPKEFVYAYALKNKWTYEQANCFFDSLPETELNDDECVSTFFTQAVLDDYNNLTDEESFQNYYETHLKYFGELHNRAYYYFSGYMNTLSSPEGEEKYSVEKVIELYLRPFEKTGRNRRELDKVQKLLRKVFPSPTLLHNISARREDVPRNLLILLYIVTENSFQDVYNECDEDYLLPEEYFENRWWGINLMLVDCGMPTLNPRNPYDRLILYALYTENEDESMLERFETIIKKVIE